MQPLPQHEGIEGLNGREPVDAVLTVGEKDLRSGNPTKNDHFFIRSRFEEKRQAEKTNSRGEKMTIGVRPPHPAFKAFNEAAPEKRKSINGILAHGQQADCFAHNLKAPKAPKGGRWPNHPNGLPFCSGDGKVATRLYAIGQNGQPDDWRQIECPNDKCEFRQGKVKVCKPFAQLLFRPVWPEGVRLPTPLTKFESHGWNTASNLLGFFEYIEQVASELQLESYSLFGMPFTLTLHRKTKPSEAQAFPVVTMSPAFDPMEFFVAQRRSLQLAGGKPMLRLVCLRDPEENSAESVAASMRALSGDPPTIPAESPAPPAGVVDAEFTEIKPDEQDDPWPQPEPIPAHVRRIIAAGEAIGKSPSEITALLGANVFETPSGAENEALRKIKAAKR